VFAHPGPQIRYKEIADYLRDTFEVSGDQTPYFVIQADMTQHFVAVGDSIRRLANQWRTGSSPDGQNKSRDAGTHHQSLLEKITAEAERYVSQDEACAYLDALSEGLAEPQCSEIVRATHTWKLQVQSDLTALSSTHDLSPIGKWLKDATHNYFASPTTTTERYTATLPDFDLLREKASWLTSPFLKPSTPKARTEERTRTIIDGFRPSAALPYTCIRFDMIPQYNNLPAFSLHVVPVVSDQRIATFVSVVRYRRTSWDTLKASAAPDWKVVESEFRGGVAATELAARLQSSLLQKIEDELESRFDSVDAAAPEDKTEPDE